MNKFKSLKESLDWVAHGKLICELLFAIAGMKAVKAMLVHIENIPDVWKSSIEWASGAVFLGMLILFFNKKKIQQSDQVNRPAAALMNAPDLNDKLPEGVDIELFFKRAYYSTQQAEVEKNFRLMALQHQPNDIAGFYLKFIGVGFIQALFDSFWWPMFKSQLVALLYVNNHNNICPMADIHKIYKEAETEYPSHYVNDNFSRWLGYLTNNGLLINHGDESAEITIRGKDYLKYLTHWGRDANSKRL